MKALAFIVALGVAVPVPAWARAPEVDPSLQEAMQHFERGIGLYEEGDFAAALFEFRKAYDTKPDYRLLYNIGVTALELKDYAASRDALAQYLEDGGQDIEQERRMEVEDQLRTLEDRVGSVALDCNVEGAIVRVDGKTVGVTPLEHPLVLNLGSHEVQLAREGHEPYRTDIEVSGGSSTTLAVSLAPVAAPALGGEPGLVEREPAQPASRVPKLRIATFVSLGLTVAAGAGLATAGSLALRADDELHREIEQFPGDPDALSSARDRRALLSTTSNVMIGVTAAFAAVTIGLGVATVVAKRRGDSASPRARLSPGGVELRF